jgi:hypothetical protein
MVGEQMWLQVYLDEIRRSKYISMIGVQMVAAILCGARRSKYGYKLNDSG